MASNPLIRELMRAIALGDGSKMKELNSRLPDADRDDYVIRVAAMFAGVVGHVFEHDQSPEAIRDFIAKISYAYRNAEPPFKPLAMEALIRALLGEDDLLDEVAAEDQLDIEILTIRMITDQYPKVRDNLEEYLNDAETLAVHWEAES
ncbi:hypothetical protein GCM10009830_05120 [Glycomyces endophyticus]|uniref:Uncharacterized protein n=1 Tax=Glycomyces endophyticus TaxID=480996 RepID=A0ABN2FZX6_9ACTN